MKTPPLGERYEELVEGLISRRIKTPMATLGKMNRNSSMRSSIMPRIMAPWRISLKIRRSAKLWSTAAARSSSSEWKAPANGAKYESEIQLRLAINHIINPFGRYVNAQTSDGGCASAGWITRQCRSSRRLHSRDRVLSIRRFLKDKLTVQDLIDMNSITQSMADFVCRVCRGPLKHHCCRQYELRENNIPQYSGCVPFPITNASSPSKTRSNCKCRQTHKVSLEARPPDYSGEGQVTIRDLVKNPCACARTGSS